MKRHRVIACPCAPLQLRTCGLGNSNGRRCSAFAHLLFDDKDDGPCGSATVVLFDYLCAAASFRLLSGCFPLSSTTLPPLGLARQRTWLLFDYVLLHGSDVVIFPSCFVVLSCSVFLSLSYTFCTCRVVHRGKFSELSTGRASLPRISFPACCGYVK